jgi:hypothetical protein
VSSWGSLSPRLNTKADCIVWFPDDFRPPRPEVTSWLTRWLTDMPDRTLIYVGRDFDAAPSYWEFILPLAPNEEQKTLIQDRLDKSKDGFMVQRQRDDKKEECEWFTVDRTKPLLNVDKLQSNPRSRATEDPFGESQDTAGPQWLDGVDVARVQIPLRDRIVPPKKADILLQSGEDMLVSRQLKNQSQLIVVANGAFLLNLPLVNHEHRKLAAALIAMVPQTEKNVVFLESGYGGPPICKQDPTPPTGWEMFGVWPTNWILFHFAVVGLLFCFARWPIFGRPRTDSLENESDFGRHVDALADMLKNSGDEQYATNKINSYRQMIEQEKQ